ncbi:hypothetical protein DPMN_071290 [Dreissena polymorpha]|uniref:Uncharacterized protein n=1 Tax=Dreissena polymorpha TaxID=45954 RepID=A0A9D4BW47_DREPO|nr:hypothetical protein DPMN_071290 [Dreissena polymorpha]
MGITYPMEPVTNVGTLDAYVDIKMNAMDARKVFTSHMTSGETLNVQNAWNRADHAHTMRVAVDVILVFMVEDVTSRVHRDV